MVELVRQKGEPLAVDQLEESDVILPPPDLTPAEAKNLFAGEGLIPS